MTDECMTRHETALPDGIIAIAAQISNTQVINHDQDNIRLVVMHPVCLARVQECAHQRHEDQGAPGKQAGILLVSGFCGWIQDPPPNTTQHNRGLWRSRGSPRRLPKLKSVSLQAPSTAAEW